MAGFPYPTSNFRMGAWERPRFPGPQYEEEVVYGRREVSYCPEPPRKLIRGMAPCGVPDVNEYDARRYLISEYPVEAPWREGPVGPRGGWAGGRGAIHRPREFPPDSREVRPNPVMYDREMVIPQGHRPAMDYDPGRPPAPRQDSSKAVTDRLSFPDPKKAQVPVSQPFDAKVHSNRIRGMLTKSLKQTVQYSKRNKSNSSDSAVASYEHGSMVVINDFHPECLKCEMCEIESFKDVESYHTHIGTEQHLEMLELFYTRKEAKINYLRAQSKVAACMKLKEIGKWKSPDMKFCNVCQCYINTEHKFSSEHQAVACYFHKTCCSSNLKKRYLIDFHEVSLLHLNNEYQRKKQAETEILERNASPFDDLEEEVANFSSQYSISKSLFPELRSGQTSPRKLEPYDPDIPVGKEFISQTLSYHCLACKDQVLVGSANVEEHCRSRGHYEAVAALASEGKESNTEAKEDEGEGPVVEEGEEPVEESPKEEEHEVPQTDEAVTENYEEAKEVTEDEIQFQVSEQDSLFDDYQRDALDYEGDAAENGHDSDEEDEEIYCPRREPKRRKM